MCLVVSDIEDSTRLSVINPHACAACQDKHDAIMMELIQQCHGSELLREGDSFRVAFKHVTSAVLFCLKVSLCLPFANGGDHCMAILVSWQASCAFSLVCDMIIRTV
jgi:class 3 adenylate cyclase